MLISSYISLLYVKHQYWISLNFQHDRGTAHTADRFMAALRNVFSLSFDLIKIWRHALASLITRYLTTCDLFFWGYLKLKMYHSSDSPMIFAWTEAEESIRKLRWFLYKFWCECSKMFSSFLRIVIKFQVIIWW